MVQRKQLTGNGSSVLVKTSAAEYPTQHTNTHTYEDYCTALTQIHQPVYCVCLLLNVMEYYGMDQKPGDSFTYASLVTESAYYGISIFSSGGREGEGGEREGEGERQGRDREGGNELTGGLKKQKLKGWNMRNLKTEEREIHTHTEI